ncbi:MAG TPA: cell division protein FtsB [Gammaproteobacteria bacterium]
MSETRVRHLFSVMRPLIVALALAFAVLQFRLWLSDGGMREVWRLEEQVALRTQENRSLEERNAALAAEVRDLKSGLAAAEERARTELGMVQPGESFYQIVPYDAARRYAAQAKALPSPEEHADGAGAAVPVRR